MHFRFACVNDFFRGQKSLLGKCKFSIKNLQCRFVCHHVPFGNHISHSIHFFVQLILISIVNKYGDSVARGWRFVCVSIVMNEQERVRETLNGNWIWLQKCTALHSNTQAGVGKKKLRTHTNAVHLHRNWYLALQQFSFHFGLILFHHQFEIISRQSCKLTCHWFVRSR